MQSVKALRNFSLFFELFEVGGEFAQDIFNPRQVLAGITEPIFCFAATFFVFGNASSFFQKQTEFFRFGFNDAADRALANDGVCPWAQACTQKHVLHVTTANRLVVDVVATGAITGQNAFDRNFSKLAPLTTSAVIRVIKHQFDTGAAGRFATGGAVENNVLHGVAAQLAGPTFSENPAHRVHDVGLTATVRAHHADQLAGQKEIRGFCK